MIFAMLRTPVLQGERQRWAAGSRRRDKRPECPHQGFAKTAHRRRHFPSARALLDQTIGWNVESFAQREKQLVEIPAVTGHGFERIERVLGMYRLGGQTALGSRRAPQLDPPGHLPRGRCHRLAEGRIAKQLSPPKETATK